MTDDVNPTWTLGSAILLNAAYPNNFDQLTSVMFETIVQHWIMKCRAFNSEGKS
jgi:hypothetical protein